jgi:hypothetical protein
MAGLVALLALLPALLFGLGRTWWAGAVTVTNVVIITVSIYLLMSPTEEEEHDESSDGEVV